MVYNVRFNRGLAFEVYRILCEENIPWVLTTTSAQKNIYTTIMVATDSVTENDLKFVLPKGTSISKC